jgi:two-component system, LuxR family, response regulator FixJ
VIARWYLTSMASSRKDASAATKAPPDAPLVVVVDDDESVRQSAQRLIRSFGYRVAAFASGAEFLADVDYAGACCLLLDVRMPEMDGLEVQRRLVERGFKIPIVFLTGRASDDEQRRARAAGAVAFLRKPVDTAALRQVLENACRRQ